VRAVLDTNVAVSALLWGGPPERLIEAAGEGRLELFTSDALLAEFAGILGRTTFAAKLLEKSISGPELVARYAQLARLIDAAQITPVVVGDPPDDAVLACALAAGADVVVSGDSDLLNLKHFQRIPILDPVAALGFVERAFAGR
jgi:putative PIN family toxin of toxin-antitoxin system